MFFEEPPALDDLERVLRMRGPTVTTCRGDGTLDCVFGGTKVQLDASHCNLIEAGAVVAGLRVAGLADLMAIPGQLRPSTGEGEALPTWGASRVYPKVHAEHQRPD